MSNMLPRSNAAPNTHIQAHALTVIQKNKVQLRKKCRSELYPVLANPQPDNTNILLGNWLYITICTVLSIESYHTMTVNIKVIGFIGGTTFVSSRYRF